MKTDNELFCEKKYKERLRETLKEGNMWDRFMFWLFFKNKEKEKKNNEIL